MFLQIHTLTSYPASLLNRDDAGLAKRIPFGNSTRVRISSQCLKRHWRIALSGDLPDVPDGLRTRSLFTRRLLPALMAEGADEERARALIVELASKVIDGGVESDGEMSQPVLFGTREIDYFGTMLLDIHRGGGDNATAVKALTDSLKSPEQRKNLKAMSKSASGLTSSLFGRFVTSDLLARVDAAVHVGHAFTVHAAETEMDYFTVVDDLNRSDETGAAHANQAELGAGVFYGYVVVDVPLLVSNLHGCPAGEWKAQDPTLPRRVLAALMPAITCRSPGAKLGSTAPYSRADFVLLETGDDQPRTLANAFIEALPTRGNLLQEATNAVARQVGRIDAMYGATAGTRCLATTLDTSSFAPLAGASLADATTRTLDAIWA